MKLHNDTIRTVNVWEERKRGKTRMNSEQGKGRGRMQKNNNDETPLSQQPMPSLLQPQPQLPVTESEPARLEFCFYV